MPRLVYYLMANTDARVSDAHRLEKVHEKKDVLTWKPFKEHDIGGNIDADMLWKFQFLFALNLELHLIQLYREILFMFRHHTAHHFKVQKVYHSGLSNSVKVPDCQMSAFRMA